MTGKIIEILAKLSPDGEKNVVNLIESDPQLVLLRVKVLEVTKDIQARLGLNWQLLFQHASEVVTAIATYPPAPIGDPNYIFAGTGINFGNFSLSYLIDMLEQDGVA